MVGGTLLPATCKLRDLERLLSVLPRCYQESKITNVVRLEKRKVLLMRSD